MVFGGGYPQRYAINCIYGDDNIVPNIYPPDPSDAATTVTSGGVDTWGAWTEILPAAVIYASDDRYFDIQALYLSGITADTYLYFEFAYGNGVDYTVIGRGWLYLPGGNARCLRGADYKVRHTRKVTGQNVYMRIKTDRAGETADIKPIMWCEGNPINPGGA